MFDEQDQKVEDMFGGIDGGAPANLPMAPSVGASIAPPAPVASAPAPTPTTVMPRDPSPTPPPPPEDILDPQSGGARRSFGRAAGIAFITLASIGLVAGGVYLGLQYMAQKKVQQTNIDPTDNVLEDTAITPEPTPVTEAPAVTEPTPTPVVDTGIDTDGDGLMDAEEDRLGTDLNLTDTDADGLNDAEEVRTYGTDPLNQDTDGDTYTDGVEVANGYNPNGTGRLFQPLPPRVQDK